MAPGVELPPRIVERRPHGSGGVPPVNRAAPKAVRHLVLLHCQGVVVGDVRTPWLPACVELRRPEMALSQWGVG